MVARPLKQKVIGLLGGSSNVATAAYYEIINSQANKQLGGWDIAETLIAGMNFGNIEALVRANDWDRLSAYIKNSVERLVAGKADILLCVSNTLHYPLEAIVQQYEIDFIHIVDPTAAAIAKAGLRRVALFGTRPVMEQAYIRDRYHDKFGIEVVVPNEAECEDIDRIIFDELVKHCVKEQSRDRYLEIARRLARDEGAEGLILGCTEIFTLLDQSHAPDLPLFNTTELHCEAAVKAALQRTV